MQGLAARTAERWLITAEHLADYFHTLRDVRLHNAERRIITRDMLSVAVAVHEPDAAPTPRRSITEFGDDIPF